MSAALDVDSGHASPRAPHRQQWRFSAVPSSVSEIRAAVREFARAHGAPEDLMPDLVLSVTEAATNAVLHAYVGIEAGEVEIVAQAGADELVVSVIDEGRGMQPRADSPGLGMGLPTIGQLTTSLDIREGPGSRGTEVRMRFTAPGVTGPAGGLSEGDERYRLLAAVSDLVEAGGWPTQAIHGLLELLVPAVADLCEVDLVGADGVPQRLAARVDGEAGEDLAAWLVSRPVARDVSASPSWGVLRSGGSIVAEFTDEFVAAVAHGAEDADRMARLGLAHWITLPVVQGGRMLGLLHLGLRAERGRPEAGDVAFLETLAERAARGLVNTQLVEDLRRTQGRLERILGALAEAVTVHDQLGQTIYANDAAARLLGAESVQEVLSARPGELAGRFIITREDGSPVTLDDLPGRRLVQGRHAEPLLTRSVHRETGRARWLLTKATLLDDDGPLAVNIIEDVTEAKEAELRLRFLARAGAVLGATLDLSRTLQDVADLVVSDLADWCVVDLAGPDGTTERVAVAHKDPEKLAMAREIDERWPASARPGDAMREMLAGGPAQLYPELTDEMLASRAEDPEHLRMLREVGMRSAMLLPMRVADRTIGVLTMITAESARAFDDAQLTFAEDIARRAAVAVENARLFSERAPAGE